MNNNFGLVGKYVNFKFVTTTAVEDPNERKRQMDKEHYASMSRAKKDHINTKPRERRMDKTAIS
jgi:hypothetical protein